MQNYKVIHGACKVLVRNVILIYSDKYNNAIMPKIIPRIIKIQPKKATKLKRMWVKFKGIGHIWRWQNLVKNWILEPFIVK